MSIQADLKRFPTRLHEDWRYFRMKKDELKKILDEGHLPESGLGADLTATAVRQENGPSEKEAEALFRHKSFSFQDDIFSRLVRDNAAPDFLILQKTPEVPELTVSTGEAREIRPADIRILLNPGINAELTVHVDAAGADSLISAQIRVYLPENTSLKLNLSSSASENAFAIIRTRVLLAENAKLLFSNLQAPAGHIRSEASFDLSGRGAGLKLHQAVIAGGSAVNDTVLKAIHSAPQTESDMHTVTYAAGNSRSALNGLIHVKPGSEEARAYQQAKNYILSPEAFSAGYPQLEIENQNVSCSHGTAMHSFDENQLFYLNARGIPSDQAKRMILKGNLDYFFRRMNEPQKKGFLKKSYAIIDALPI
ncbi:MAG: SufD family Fe-S cluster assembly protein [Acidobacteria bacterium]|nr:SufD family Fe-S cluster assembly protein [Acidobacteriota bacterium]